MARVPWAVVRRQGFIWTVAVTVSRARSSRDIIFSIPTDQGGGVLSCMIARGASKLDGRKFKIRRIAVAAEEGAPKRLRETAVTYKDWTRGAGFGRADEGTDRGYNYGTFLYARSRNMLMPAGEMTEIEIPSDVVQMDTAFELADATWITCQNTKMLKVIGGTLPDALDAGITFTAGAITRSGVVFDDKAWISNGAAARIWNFNGTNWTAAAEDMRLGILTTTNWTFGAQMALNAGLIGRSERTVVGTHPTGSGLYHCVDDPGVIANWAGPNPVGDSIYPMRAINGFGESVFAAKADGVYVVQGGGRMPNIAPHWREQYDFDNGGVVWFYDGVILASTVQYLDMLQPDPSQVGLQNPCHPGASESAENSPITWRCTAITNEGGGVLAAFWDGTNSYVMWGKRTARLGLNSRNPMTWYGAEAVVPGACTMLHVMPSRGNSPRWLLIATRPTLVSGTPKLYAQSLPAEHTPYMSWKIKRYPHRFAPQFTCVFATDDLGDPASPKNMRYVAAVTENASNTRSLVVDTSTDGGATTTQIEINDPGRVVAVFDTATAAGVNVTVTVTGNSEPTEPLVLRSVKLRGTINDERTVVYEVPLEIGRDLETNRGTTDPSSPFVKRAQLYALLEAGPIQVTDWNNQTRTMVLEDIDDAELLDDDAAAVTIYANITVSVMLSNSVYGSSQYGVGRYG